MSWNERATQTLRAHGAALLGELYKATAGAESPKLYDLTHTRLTILVDLLIDNVDPTLTPVREFIDQQLGGA